MITEQGTRVFFDEATWIDITTDPGCVVNVPNLEDLSKGLGPEDFKGARINHVLALGAMDLKAEVDRLKGERDAAWADNYRLKNWHEDDLTRMNGLLNEIDRLRGLLGIQPVPTIQVEKS